MYANSRFKKKVNEWGVTQEWIEPGDKISQDDLGIGDEEWQYLISVNAVVADYPDELDHGTPLAEYYSRPENREEAMKVEEAKLKSMKKDEFNEQPPPSAQPHNPAERAATASDANPTNPSTPSSKK
jgi:hypothetical protein